MSRTVVVGAGVVGLACALALRKRGDDVMVLDKGEPGGGCSRGNTGWVVPSFSTPLPEPGLVWRSLRWMFRADSPLYIAPSAAPKLALWLWRFWRHCNAADYLSGVAALAAANATTMELYDALLRDGVRFEMHRNGLLFVFLSEQSQREALDDLQVLVRYGYRMPELLMGRELRAFEPALAENVKVGLWLETERHVRPETLSAGLVDRLQTLGVEIRAGVEVLRAAGGKGRLRALRTADTELAADRFVLAAGAWSGLLARALGCPLPVQAGKGTASRSQRRVARWCAGPCISARPTWPSPRSMEASGSQGRWSFRGSTSGWMGAGLWASERRCSDISAWRRRRSTEAPSGWGCGRSRRTGSP